jgi:putative addiction module CopG family antidote
MQTMNISLPDPLKEFVDHQIAEGRYSSVSEYIRELIRDDEKRKAEQRARSAVARRAGKRRERVDASGLRRHPQGSAGATQAPKKEGLMATVYKRASARRDMVEHYVYLAEHAGIEIAERFLSSADESFSDLVRHPGLGTALSSRDPNLTGLRKWRVKRV